MKNICLFILFAISSIASSTNTANDNAQPSARHQYTAAQYLKNYALTACLYDAYQAKEVKQDFLDAALGYKELGSLPIEAYNEAGMLAQKFLKK